MLAAGYSKSDSSIHNICDTLAAAPRDTSVLVIAGTSLSPERGLNRLTDTPIAGRVMLSGVSKSGLIRAAVVLLQGR